MKNKLLLIISIFFLGINSVLANDSVTFSKCIDGDTFKIILNDSEYTIRMLAIDTPESVTPNKEVEYYGKEASEYTCMKISNAKNIELEYDENSDKTDKYDRLLAWVFIDGKLLQKELVEKGYAKVAYLYNEYKYTTILQEKQEIASYKEIGIWNMDAASKFSSSSNDDIVDEYENVEIIVIICLFLILIFASNKNIKNKTKKKIKSYIK